MVVLVLALFFVSALASKPFSVAAYLPEWRYEGLDFNNSLETVTHLIFFSLETSGRGELVALDRMPKDAIIEEAKVAAKKNDAKLLLCIGGNGRSSGFSPMVKSKKARTRFINNLLKLLDEKGLDGVDYNWEYPGFVFGRGYDERQLLVDQTGFAKLLEETHAAFAPSGKVITLAYYPDKKQEVFLTEIKAHLYADLMHMMTYDQHGRHSTMQFAQAAVDQALSLFPPEAHSHVTLGLPFYGRNTKTGDWKTYEDLIQQHKLTPPMDEVGDEYFNGVDTIQRKTRLAYDKGIGGVMIWEVGQDCRVNPVTRSGTTHVQTCPNGREDSLLYAISRTIAQNNEPRTDL